MDVKAAGEKIKQYRKIRGLTQEELAQKAGLSTMSIRRYESGGRIAPQEALLKIAKALGIHLRDLADYSWLEEIDRELGPEKLKALQEESSSSGTSDEHELSETERRIVDLLLKLDDPARSALLGYANRLAEEMRNKPDENILMDIESQLERYRHGLLMGIATAQANFSIPPEDINVDSISLTPKLNAMVEDAVKKQREILEAEQQKK